MFFSIPQDHLIAYINNVLNCLFFFYSPRKPVTSEFNGLFDCESWPILPEKYLIM